MFAAAKKRKLISLRSLNKCSVIVFEKKVNNIFKKHCDNQKRFYICSRLCSKGFKLLKRQVH